MSQHLIIKLFYHIKQEYFDLTNDDHKTVTLHQCNFAWKRFKTTLKAEYMIPKKKPYKDDKYSFIEPGDWEKFIRKHQSTENMVC